MTTTPGHPSRYWTSVTPVSAARQLADMQRLGVIFDECGAHDLADGWKEWIHEMDGRIREGWRDRHGRKIQRFDVKVKLEPDGANWNFHATIQSILQ
jgi:hypothetical protein